MSDLQLTKNGDLQTIQTSVEAIDKGQVIKPLYDLSVTEDNLTELIKRAIKTPRGAITISVNELDGIALMDSEYGSNLYRELSEGITINFLSRLKSHIMDTLQTANLLVNILDVRVGVLDLHTVQINIVYSDNTPSTFIELNL